MQTRFRFVKRLIAISLCFGLVTGAWFVALVARKQLLLLQGYVVICDKPVQKTEPTDNRNVWTVGFDLENLSSQPVVISGMDSSCSCVSTVNAPLTIAARSSRRLVVAVEGPCVADRVRVFNNRLFVATPCPRPELVIEFICAESPTTETAEVPKPDPMFTQ